MRISLNTIYKTAFFTSHVIKAYCSLTDSKFKKFISQRRKLLWLRITKENLYFKNSTVPQLGRIFAKHYEIIGNKFSASSLDQMVIGHGLTIYRHNESIKLCLAPARQNDTEAEFYIRLYQNDVQIYILGFVVVDRDTLAQKNNVGILITRLQGYKGNRELIHAAIKNLGDISLDRILFASLNGLADFLKIKYIYGIPHHRQTCYREVLQSFFIDAYDRFWNTFEHQQVGDYFQIELPVTEKSLSSIRANHRKRTEQKRNIKNHLINTVHQNLLRTNNEPTSSPVQLPVELKPERG